MILSLSHQVKAFSIPGLLNLFKMVQDAFKNLVKSMGLFLRNMCMHSNIHINVYATTDSSCVIICSSMGCELKPHGDYPRMRAKEDYIYQSERNM